MRTLTFLLVTLASVLGLAAASQAAIEIDFLVGGSSTVTAAESSTITVEIYLTATGSTTVTHYQFSIIWDPTELFYIDNPPLDDGNPYNITEDSLSNSGPNHGGGDVWLGGGARESLLNQSLGELPAAIAAFNTIGGDPANNITAADGLVFIGSLQFHVLSAIDDGIDVTGCISCASINTGDGILTGDNDLLPDSEITFNGIQVVHNPEPTTASLLGLGLLGLAAAGRRRKAARPQ